MNQWISDRGDCRTAVATPCLLIILVNSTKYASETNTNLKIEIYKFANRMWAITEARRKIRSCHENQGGDRQVWRPCPLGQPPGTGSDAANPLRHPPVARIVSISVIAFILVIAWLSSSPLSDRHPPAQEWGECQDLKFPDQPEGVVHERAWSGPAGVVRHQRSRRGNFGSPSSSSLSSPVMSLWSDLVSSFSMASISW